MLVGTMAPLPYIDPPGRDWDLRPLAIVVSDDALARAVLKRMRGGKGRHWGLFEGGEGEFAGSATALAVCGPGENLAYAAVRQLSFLFRPNAVLYLGNALGAREDLRPGDLAFVREARRVFHPIAVADNMFHDDEVVFNSDELKAQVLEAPRLQADESRLVTVMSKVRPADFTTALQSSFAAITVGSASGSPAAHRGYEFARHRYGIDATDHASYGFLAALRDEQLPGLALLQIRGGCSAEYAAEYRHQRRRFNALAAEVLEAVCSMVMPTSSGQVRAL